MKPLPPFRYLWPFWVALATNIFATICVLILIGDPKDFFGDNVKIFRELTRFLAGYIFFPSAAILCIYMLRKHRFRSDLHWPLSVWLFMWPLAWGWAFPPDDPTALIFLIWLIGLLVLYSIRFFAKDDADKTKWSMPKWLILSLTLVLGMWVSVETEFEVITGWLINYEDKAMVYYFFVAQVIFIVLTYLYALDRVILAARKGEVEYALIEEIGKGGNG